MTDTTDTSAPLSGRGVRHVLQRTSIYFKSQPDYDKHMTEPVKSMRPLSGACQIITDTERLALSEVEMSRSVRYNLAV